MELRRARIADFDDGWQLLTEYFEAVDVVVRDTGEDVVHYLDDPQGGLWLAYVDGHPAGCILLRALPQRGYDAREIKRLYVRPAFRKLGLARLLLAALEEYARGLGVETLYLDSKDDLTRAINFYHRAGYEDCERFNENPQATVFMKKSLAAPVFVREFRAGDGEAFWTLNEAWISALFQLEEKDLQVLKNPDRYILSEGGRIYFACRGSRPIGCCALINMGHGTFELGKMAVAQSERGNGVGRKLLEHVIGEARRLGIRRLYLETSKKLKNAIHLYEAVGFRWLDPAQVTPSPYARSDVYMELVLAPSA